MGNGIYFDSKCLLIDFICLIVEFFCTGARCQYNVSLHSIIIDSFYCLVDTLLNGSFSFLTDDNFKSMVLN